MSNFCNIGTELKTRRTRLKRSPCTLSLSSREFTYSPFIPNARRTIIYIVYNIWYIIVPRSCARLNVINVNAAAAVLLSLCIYNIYIILYVAAAAAACCT